MDYLFYRGNDLRQNRITMKQTTTHHPHLFAAQLALLITLPLSGCTPIHVTRADGTSESMSIDAFKSYSEAVFRRQNQASDRFIMLESELDDEHHHMLAEAERLMLQHCAPLNKIAAQQRDQQSIDLKLKMSISETIDGCDRATRKMELLLDEQTD